MSLNPYGDSTNVAIEANVKTSIQATVEFSGKLDIVINNAGLGTNQRSWEEVIRVNVPG